MPIIGNTDILRFVRAANTNFYYAFLFLPREKREAIFAAYAFSRRTDDLVDDAVSPEEARTSLAAWRRELDACYNGTPADPVALGLQRVLRRFPIRRTHFDLLVDGVEMDLTMRRYETFDELYQYCYRVASAVGLICIEIFGYRSPEAEDYAINLGIAVQLTNILRDISEDAAKDRIYLPTEDMERFHYTETDLFNGVYNQRFTDLMQFECNRARAYYEKARRLLPEADRNRLCAAEIMGGIYARLLEQIERSNYNVFEKRAQLSSLSKIIIAVRALLANRVNVVGRHA